MALARPAAGPASRRFAGTRQGPRPRSQQGLRVVDPAATAARRDRRRLAVIAGSLLFAATLAGNVGVHAQTTQGQFELERLEATTRQRQGDYQELRLQVAELEAPQRILARARQLGMIEPARVTYLTPTSKTSTPVRPGDAAPEAASTNEAAQGWVDVKPHLDRRR